VPSERRVAPPAVGTVALACGQCGHALATLALDGVAVVHYYGRHYRLKKLRMRLICDRCGAMLTILVDHIPADTVD
jgi:ribosomal protein S27AE